MFGIERAKAPFDVAFKLARFTGQSALQGAQRAYHIYGTGGAFDNFKTVSHQRLVSFIDTRIAEYSLRTRDSALAKMDEHERIVTMRLDDAEEVLLPGLQTLRAHIDAKYHSESEIDLSVLRQISRRHQEAAVDRIAAATQQDTSEQ